MPNLRLYLDEDMPVAVASSLRGRGFDVICALEADALGEPDKIQLEIAAGMHRAIVTRNIKDYVALGKEYSRTHQHHFGIILTKKLRVGEIVIALAGLLSSKSQEEVHNHVLWI